MPGHEPLELFLGHFHCICVVRDDEHSEFKVLSPCGVCQERLRYWGEDVRVGVTTKDKSLKYVRLGELMPYYWGNAYEDVGRRHMEVNGKYIRGYIVPKFNAEPVVVDKPVARELISVQVESLKKGSKGGAVKAMQILLAGNGCECGIYGADGDFGSATDSALKKFQKKKKLEVDGICGPATWAALLGMK